MGTTKTFWTNVESSYTGGAKPGQRCSWNHKREWALSFWDYSQVMIDYIKPTAGSYYIDMVGGDLGQTRRHAMSILSGYSHNKTYVKTSWLVRGPKRGLSGLPTSKSTLGAFFLGGGGVDCPKKVHFQNRVSISDGYNNLKIVFVQIIDVAMFCAGHPTYT